MNATTTTEPAKATLSEPTRILFQIASRSHTWCELLGIEVIERGDVVNKLRYQIMPRSWLVPHPTRMNELSFDPDIFAKRLAGGMSDGERHMSLFLLNVWNPGYARQQKGWNFDLFAALRQLDGGNCAAIAWFLHCPIWP